ncbi:MAG TPA: hypothetical protein VGF24_11930 [Vicinamibacterales bacterium]|jgi:hypothetical protein
MEHIRTRITKLPERLCVDVEIQVTVRRELAAPQCFRKIGQAVEHRCILNDDKREMLSKECGRRLNRRVEQSSDSGRLHLV